MSKISKDELFESVTVTEVVDLNGEIGRGSYGVVKKVSLHGTVCAAKVVHEILLTGGVEDKNKPVQDFILECYKCSTLRHPNLVQFLGLYYPDKTVTIPWLIMEMLDTSLRYLLEKHDKPSDIHLARKMSILQDVSLGIQYLHAQKIIHRDLSSNNILLTKHLVAKVADLGVAKLISPHQLKTLTETPGTLVFMPPEVQEHSPHYGMPVDVFSFGCVTVHLMSHQWPAPEGRGVSEIEKRWKYVREVQIMPPLIALISDCLENEPNKRPIISEVVQKLESIVSENSLVVSDVVEIEKELASGNGNEVTSVGREAAILSCCGPKSVKLTTKIFKEKAIKQSEFFLKTMEDVQFPGSPLTKGSYFVFLRENKLLVHCNLKRYRNPIGLYILTIDLNNGKLDWIDQEIRQACSFKDSFLAMECSPSKIFYTLDLSSRIWTKSSLPSLPQSQIRYPDMLMYSSLLLVISGSCLQVLKLDSARWFVFKLSIPDRTIEASLTTYYTILDDQLFICYAKKKELYSLDLLTIKDAIFNKPPQPENDVKEEQVSLTLMLYPVNFILLHKTYVVALLIENTCVQRGWYYGTRCNHWHNIATFVPYVDGQWFTMEDGSAAVAELSAVWHFWYNGYYWDFSVKVHQLELTDYK